MNQTKSTHPKYAALMKDRHPSAMANLIGSSKHPDLRGTVLFYHTPLGVLVSAEVNGLPRSNRLHGAEIFGFHIHEGGLCSGERDDPFANAGGHYDPSRLPHPRHAGDLPSLFGNDGYAWMAVVTNRFRLEDVIGRTVVVHDAPDDFYTQPAGNAGARIGCGVIYSVGGRRGYR